MSQKTSTTDAQRCLARLVPTGSERGFRALRNTEEHRVVVHVLDAVRGEGDAKRGDTVGGGVEVVEADADEVAERVEHPGGVALQGGRTSGEQRGHLVGGEFGDGVVLRADQRVTTLIVGLGPRRGSLVRHGEGAGDRLGTNRSRDMNQENCRMQLTRPGVSTVRCDVRTVDDPYQGFAPSPRWTKRRRGVSRSARACVDECRRRWSARLRGEFAILDEPQEGKGWYGKQAPFYGKAPRARRAFEDGPLVRDPRVRVRPGTAPDENNSEMTVCFAVPLDQSKSRTRMREVVPYLQGSRFQKESYGNAVYEKRK